MKQHNFLVSCSKFSLFLIHLKETIISHVCESNSSACRQRGQLDKKMFLASISFNCLTFNKHSHKANIIFFCHGPVNAVAIDKETLLTRTVNLKTHIVGH